MQICESSFGGFHERLDTLAGGFPVFDLHLDMLILEGQLQSDLGLEVYLENKLWSTNSSGAECTFWP
jgi:hypothetical protein